MAKVITDHTITADDISEFLKKQSDFSFEMKVLKELIGLGFKCSHSGSYGDLLTEKIRQFDIVAKKENGIRKVELAVECKNIQPYNPLLIYAVPRKKDECFLEILASALQLPQNLVKDPSQREGNRINHNCWSLRMKANYSPYDFRPTTSKAHLVGKAMDQVAKYNGEKKNEFVFRGEDAEVFSKYTQAISSLSADIKQDVVDMAENSVGKTYFKAYLPLVVVPDRTLWIAEFAEDGSPQSGPYQTNHVSYFVNHPITVSSVGHIPKFHISHIEIMEVGYLKKFLSYYLEEDGHHGDSRLFYMVGHNANLTWFS